MLRSRSFQANFPRAVEREVRHIINGKLRINYVRIDAAQIQDSIVGNMNILLVTNCAEDDQMNDKEQFKLMNFNFSALSTNVFERIDEENDSRRDISC
jgi:hypothetical protein